MAYQTGRTIKETLDDIGRRNLVLPAIQREFVWNSQQICRFFDSLLQGYPFGTFLYWNIQPEHVENHTYYDFVLNFDQRKPYCPPANPIPGKELTAVLDGQQRLTALNIGFLGSAAWKLPKKFFKSPHAFPVRHLYLDLLWTRGDDDQGRQYRFEFLTDEERRDKKNNEHECWYRVSDIWKRPTIGHIMRWVKEHNAAEGAEALGQLFQIAHVDPVVVAYQETSQELDKVLQIFIRMNSGGTTLSYSDLLLSVAVAAWKELDARQEIRTLVQDLNGIGDGFRFSKDFVLKAGLMLCNIGSVAFKVDNFNKENMYVLEDNWRPVKRALERAVQLVSQFGFNATTLRADSAVLPIAYYIHHRDHNVDSLTEQDRRAIREWLVHSILKSGVWGSGLDTLLTALRQSIRDSHGLFPAAAIRKRMAKSGRPLSFDPDEVEDLADMRYRDSRCFALLSLLFPSIDVTRSHFHIDHIFPQVRFRKTELRQAGVPDDEHAEFAECRDGLANLQLLEGKTNGGKLAKLPYDWLSEMDTETRRAHCERHLLGDVPEHMVDFLSFYETRRCALRERIATLLGTEMPEPAEVE